jgi:hypothetical protein
MSLYGLNFFVDNRSRTLFFVSKLGDGVLFILLVLGSNSM